MLFEFFSRIKNKITFFTINLGYVLFDGSFHILILNLALIKILLRIVCCITSFFVKKLLISITNRSKPTVVFIWICHLGQIRAKKKIELCNKLAGNLHMGKILDRTPDFFCTCISHLSRFSTKYRVKPNDYFAFLSVQVKFLDSSFTPAGMSDDLLPVCNPAAAAPRRADSKLAELDHA